MELNHRTTKNILWIITFTIVLYGVIQNYIGVFNVFKYVLALFFPFILGSCVAFILNVPMRAIEKRVVAPLLKGKPKLQKFTRALSLIITILLVIALILLVIFIIAPEIGRAFTTIANGVPGFLADVKTWATDIFAKYPDISSKIMSLNLDMKGIYTKLIQFVQNAGGSFLSTSIGVATGVANGVVSFFLGFVFSIYVLFQKEKLAKQATQIMYAFLPNKVTERTIHIGRMAEQTFSRFLSGQCVEAVILGLMFFVSMMILRFPYPLMISVLIGVTALIPMFGAFIGLAIGDLLLFIVDPVRALWFILLFIILQQIEGDFIYPHVVGNSVGLPSIWVLVAVTVGGSAMGISGMLIFIPVASVLYALLREEVYARLKIKQLEI